MLQTRTVEPATLGLLKSLMSQSLVEPFYLVGGTALALQMGHRFSVDLDLFTHLPYDKEVLFDNLKQNFDMTIEFSNNVITIGYINEVKIDLVNVRYTPQYPMLTIEGVRMLDIRDIAAMKLNAIAQRGNKKDFYDMYFLFKSITLADMLTDFETKFKTQNSYQVLKSLTYFADADEFSDPIVFDKKLTWDKVKTSISKTVNSFLTTPRQ
jgi:predicted nucleotidyltransferase component of viral defense system